MSDFIFLKTHNSGRKILGFRFRVIIKNLIYSHELTMYRSSFFTYGQFIIFYKIYVNDLHVEDLTLFFHENVKLSALSFVSLVEKCDVLFEYIGKRTAK